MTHEEIKKIFNQDRLNSLDVDRLLNLSICLHCYQEDYYKLPKEEYKRKDTRLVVLWKTDKSKIYFSTMCGLSHEKTIKKYPDYESELMSAQDTFYFQLLCNKYE